MLEALRLRLTLWFVILSLVLYATGGFFGIFVLASALTRSLDDELRRLLPEIRPSVEMFDGKPSLHTWALNAKHVNAKFLPTIQIFDNAGTLLESYGAPGVNHLQSGT